MVIKGISKNVVVIKSPDPRYFEQAIFILRDDAVTRGGKTREKILEDAERVAKDYLNSCKFKRVRLAIPPTIIIAASIVLIGVALLAVSLLT